LSRIEILAKTSVQVVEFIDCIKMSEDFADNKKVAKVNAKNSALR